MGRAANAAWGRRKCSTTPAWHSSAPTSSQGSTLAQFMGQSLRSTLLTHLHSRGGVPLAGSHGARLLLSGSRQGREAGGSGRACEYGKHPWRGSEGWTVQTACGGLRRNLSTGALELECLSSDLRFSTSKMGTIQASCPYSGSEIQQLRTNRGPSTVPGTRQTLSVTNSLAPSLHGWGREAQGGAITRLCYKDTIILYHLGFFF